MFGTIMAANVWMRILPAQRKMIEAIKAGQKPNEKLAAQAKLRSKQNTFLAVPLVILMLSPSHYAATTGGFDWVYLAVLIPVGWLADHQGAKPNASGSFLRYLLRLLCGRSA